MSDARSLLRAAASQRDRGSGTGALDRWASFHPTTGALRCAACDFTPIKHERLWGAHAASASHRQRVQQRLQEETASERAQPLSEGPKRKGSDEAAAPETKRLRGDEQPVPASEQDTTNGAAKASGDAQAARAAAPAAEPAVDPEWEEFQRTVLAEANAIPAHTQQEQRPDYAHATISVAPQLRRDGDEEPQAEEPAETEEQKRARLDREEREEILSRLDEEQRVQDEGEERYVCGAAHWP